MMGRDEDVIHVGDEIRFDNDRRWWKVRDRDARFIVATQQASFQPKGDLWYTVVDLTGWASKRYNGAGNGVVRSSLNTMGGGWDLGPNGEGSEGILPALYMGEFELSHRRVKDVKNIERREAKVKTPMCEGTHADEIDGQKITCRYCR